MQSSWRHYSVRAWCQAIGRPSCSGLYWTQLAHAVNIVAVYSAENLQRELTHYTARRYCTHLFDIERSAVCNEF